MRVFQSMNGDGANLTDIFLSASFICLLLSACSEKTTEAPAVREPFAEYKVESRVKQDLVLLATDAPCVGAHGDRTCLKVRDPNGQEMLIYDGIIGLPEAMQTPSVIPVVRVTYDSEGFPLDIGTVQYFMRKDALK